MTGVWRLVRLAARRDRIILPVWILAIALLAWAVMSSFLDTHPTEADRVITATLSATNPLARIFDGPASGTSVGALAMVEGSKVFAILTAFMAAQTVVRHTRAEEETGRAELVGSAVVGRFAPLTAALVVALGACVVLGGAVAVGIGVTGVGWSGAWAAGLSVAGIGWVFAGIAAVGAQVFSTSRGATGAAAVALGGAFLLRAAGDLTGEADASGVVVVSAWPSWLSPLGWGQQVRPFYADRWWVLGLFGVATVLLVLVAALLAARRDVGTGLIVPRPGPSRAPATLLSTMGLTWRLQRPLLGLWLTGMVIAGAAFGTVGDTFADYIAQNDAIRGLLQTITPGAEPLELFQAVLMALLGVVSAGYTIQALLRMRAEEITGRLEPVLATATGRARWLASHAAVAFGGTVLILASCGLAGGLTYAAMTGDWGDALRGQVAAALVQVPAALALAGFVVAVFGLLPRWSGPIAWFALAAALVMGQLGALLDLPQWLLNVSPFTHVPAIPAQDLAVVPLLWLAGAAAALAAVGFAAFRRRDLAVNA